MLVVVVKISIPLIKIKKLYSIIGVVNKYRRKIEDGAVPKEIWEVCLP